MKKVYYLSMYPYYDSVQSRFGDPAAALQSGYLAKLLGGLGYEVEIVSPNVPGRSKGYFEYKKGFRIPKDDNISIYYFPVIESRFRTIRLLGRVIVRLLACVYLCRLCSDAPIIIYHSVYYSHIYRLLHLIKRKYILEVEEVYADVTQKSNERTKELKMISLADAYIIPNRLMYPAITGDKQWVLYHGTCRMESQRCHIFNDGRVHIVYAGTLDPRKMGDMIALDAAKFLDDSFHIHVLGVGYPENLSRIEKRIAELEYPHCKVSFHDPLYGEEYISFIQSCDIGLYPQSIDGVDIHTSFPSKIMSYLTNGLRVVATKTQPLIESEVADLLFFADSNSPRDIARAISIIDMNDDYCAEDRLREIETKLKCDMSIMLDGVRSYADK